MTAAQIDGMARAVVAIISGIALAKGVGDASTWAVIAGSIGTLVSGLWSIWSNTQASLINEVAKDPQVAKIEVTSNRLANELPSTKVVPQGIEQKAYGL